MRRGTRALSSGLRGDAHRHRPDREVHPLPLDLANGAATVPRSLVGKFPSDDPTSRQTGVDLGNYRREVEFYRQLVSRLTIRTPRCYYAAIEGVGPHFALLLSDATPGRARRSARGLQRSRSRGPQCSSSPGCTRRPGTTPPSAASIGSASRRRRRSIATAAGTSRCCPASSIATHTVSSPTRARSSSGSLPRTVIRSTGGPIPSR